MRIVTYNLMLDQDRKPMLVKDEGVNYSKAEILSTPESIRNVLVDVFCADHLAEEHGWLFAFDMKRHLLGAFEVSHGSVAYTSLGVREIFVRLCLCGACSFTIAHNHPSGVVAPSDEDLRLTKYIKRAGKLMGIQLDDHVIIGGDAYFSMFESGILSDEFVYP